jgi:cytochrome b subunit of formate dehydrogenase
MNRILFSVGIGVLLFLSCWVLLPSHAAEDDADRIAPSDVDTCLACHEDPPIQDHLAASAHKKLLCQSCHTGVDRFPHPEQAIARKPECGTCHAALQKSMAASIHRKLSDVRTSAKTTCAVCHAAGAHQIKPLTGADRTAQCKVCHVQEAVAVTSSVHKGGNTPHGKRSDCLSCHNNDPHNITSVHGGAERTIATCRQCHKEAAAGITRGAHGTGMAKKVGVNCLTCHGDNPHTIISPETSGSAVCRQCHIDLAAQVRGSAHGNTQKIDCATCHGASVHGVPPVSPKTLKEKNASCKECHPSLSNTLVHTIHSQHATGDERARPECTDCHGTNLHTIQSARQMSPEAKEATCLECHRNISEMVENSVHMPKDPEGQFKYCTVCHTSDLSKSAESQVVRLRQLVLTAPSATIRIPTQQGSEGLSVIRVQDRVVVTSENACRDCHKDHAAQAMSSRHDKPDKVAGDHPTCFICHAGGPHNMVKPKTPTAQAQVELCVGCHQDEALMKRYGMTIEPVVSYLKSFHGKAVMRFGQQDSATCVDCHGLHAVLPHTSAQSPVHESNVTETCRQCHPGAKMNFSLSGANHLSLKIEETPLLRGQELFFKVLTVSVILGLMLLIVLDLRRKVFSHDYHPESGRPVGFLIALSFFTVIVGIGMVALEIRGARYPVAASLGLMAVAMLMYLFIRQPKEHKREKVYPRFNLSQRTQHFLLVASFTVLVVTGMPIRFAEIAWAPDVQLLFGGFAGARLAHRIAAVVMIAAWVWHTGYLLYLWKKAKFSFKSWTMLPNKKDFIDFYHTVTYGVGLRKEPPSFDRFQFREKFDYFAVYWGMPIMVFSGLILWFPIFFSNYLTNLGFGVAYIAHSDEAVLAMLAIVIWHFYNTHFNPDTFPMNRTWLTGTMTESEMLRDHPFEKARMDNAKVGVEEKASAPG